MVCLHFSTIYYFELRFRWNLYFKNVFLRFRWSRPSIWLRWKPRGMVGPRDTKTILGEGAMHHLAVWQLHRSKNKSFGNIEYMRAHLEWFILNSLSWFPILLAKRNKYARREYRWQRWRKRGLLCLQQLVSAQSTRRPIERRKIQSPTTILDFSCANAMLGFPRQFLQKSNHYRRSCAERIPHQRCTVEHARVCIRFQLSSGHQNESREKVRCLVVWPWFKPQKDFYKLNNKQSNNNGWKMLCFFYSWLDVISMGINLQLNVIRRKNCDKNAITYFNLLI